MGQTQWRTACFKDITTGKCCFSQRSYLYNKLHGDPVWWGKKPCRLGKESVTWFSFVCYHGNVCERKRELLLVPTAQHKPSLTRNKLPCGLETAHGSHVKFKCKKNNSSVTNRHRWRGWVDGQFAKVSWELDQTKHKCNLAWMTAWKSHAEFTSKLGSCSSHMGFALPLFFF